MNSSLINLSVQRLKQAVGIKEKIESLQSELTKILGVPTGNSRANSKPKRRKMSAAAIARIRAAQKARWARIKGRAGGARKRKRKMSPAARARLSAIARARWKTAKAQGRHAL